LKYLERVSSSFLQSLKQVVVATGYLDNAVTVKPILPFASSAVSALTEAVGLANHHDAITGTSKQHVADDYVKILDRALSQAEDVLAAAISGYGPWQSSPKDAEDTSGRAMKFKRHVGDRRRPKPLPPLTICRLSLNESSCPLTVELAVGQDALVVAYNPLPRRLSQQLSVFLGAAAMQSDVQVVVLAEGTMSIAAEIVPLSVSALSTRGNGAAAANTRRSETDNAGQSINSSGRSRSLEEVSKKEEASEAVAMLVFQADDVPALSTARFVIRMQKAAAATATTETTSDSAFSAAQVLKEHSSTEAVSTGLVEITNGEITVSFDPDTGLMKSIARRVFVGGDENGVRSKKGHGYEEDVPTISAAVTNAFAYYKSYGSPGLRGQVRAKPDTRDAHIRNLHPADDLRDDDPTRSAQASGAYIFRPSVENEIPTFISDATPSATNGEKADARARLTVVRGQLISEVRQYFDSWAVQIVRIRSGSPVVEVEWTVGPIPVADQVRWQH
jgi:hypothetical protein